VKIVEGVGKAGRADLPAAVAPALEPDPVSARAISNRTNAGAALLLAGVVKSIGSE